MKVIKVNAKKLKISTLINIKYQNEIKVSFEQLKRRGLVENPEDMYNLPTEKVNEIIRSFANYSLPRLPKKTKLDKGKHTINKI